MTGRTKAVGTRTGTSKPELARSASHEPSWVASSPPCAERASACVVTAPAWTCTGSAQTGPSTTNTATPMSSQDDRHRTFTRSRLVGARWHVKHPDRDHSDPIKSRVVLLERLRSLADL